MRDVPRISLKKATKAMQHGASLMMMHDNRSPTGKSWCVVPGGTVSDEDARRLIARGDVISGQDELFTGEGRPQTYRIVR